jgi:hypothetical protein
LITAGGLLARNFDCRWLPSETTVTKLRAWSAVIAIDSRDDDGPAGQGEGHERRPGSFFPAGRLKRRIDPRNCREGIYSKCRIWLLNIMFCSDALDFRRRWLQDTVYCT